MMKIFTNKSIWQKIVIVLVVILLFQAIAIKPVHAAGDVVEFGGKLMSPILSLLVSLGDGIMDLIGRAVMGATSSLYEVEMGNSFWETLGTVLVAIAAAAIAVALVVLGGAAILAVVGITATVTAGLGTVVVGLGAGLVAGVWFHDEMLPENVYLPMYTYSAEEIFKGNILLFNVDFFSEQPEIQEKTNEDGIVQYYYYIDGNGNEIKTSKQDSAAMLQGTISSWYSTIRNICLVAMLSVLVYIGIRMLLSSVASDKAKYKTMLKDWFIGLCLLFLMHYIMAFSVTLVGKLTDVVKTSIDENIYTVVMQDKDGKLKEAVDEEHLNQPDLIQQDSNGNDVLVWPTNLMGSLRLQLQMQQYGAQYVGLAICFISLSLFTLFFTFTYLKRLLYMAFLTIIAPMVALTYCIDKINDGQAQGFNKWFKEYIFNLLIQPMHLLLYYILVTSAFELAGQNVIYSLVAIGFMLPAEKLLRSLFGFEKAQTPEMLGPAGAALAMSAVNKLTHMRARGKGTDGKGGTGNSEDSNSGAPMPRETDPIAAFGEGSADNSGANIRGATLNSNALEAPSSSEEDTLGEEEPRLVLSASEQIRMDRENAQREREEQERRKQEQAEREAEALRLAQQEEAMGKGGKAKRAIVGYAKGVGRRIHRNMSSSWSAQKAAVRNTPKALKRNIENAHPIRTMGKIAAGAGVATATGALGTAVAVSSGNPENLAQMGLGAAAGGFALGSGLSSSIKAPLEHEETAKIYDSARNKGEFKPDAMNDYVSDFLSNEQNRLYFEQKFGKEEMKKMMKKGGEVEQYLYSDITDAKEMAAAHKLQRESVVRNVDEAIAVSQLSEMIGSNTNNMTTKKREEWQARLSEMAGNSGVKDKDKFAKKRLEEIDKYHEFKK